MTFEEAIVKLRDGRRITRLEWKDNKTFGLLRSGQVQIFLSSDMEYHAWTINDGDLEAEDWVVVHDN
jgi:hypothetical protein